MEGYMYNLLRFLVSLRHAGIEARKFIRQGVHVAEPNPHCYTPQFICAALVSTHEIIAENHSVVNSFMEQVRAMETNMRNSVDENQNTIRPKPFVKDKFLCFDRVAVILNCNKKHFFTHGETRLFDHDRTILSTIIDENRSPFYDGLSMTSDRAGCVLLKLSEQYHKQFGAMDTSLFLVFSHYIPCSLDFHECSRVLHDYVETSKKTVCVSYEDIFRKTDVVKAESYLDHDNLIVFPKKSFRKQLARDISVFEDFDLSETYLDLYTDEEYVQDYIIIPQMYYSKQRRCRHKRRTRMSFGRDDEDKFLFY